MRYVFTTIICTLLAASFVSASAQKSKSKSSDTKTSDNTVWFNARHGDADAMNQIGVWYYTGNKVERDYRQAYEWWRQGALLQNAKAIANLGVCYQYGRGVERDSVEAIRLYLTAIENGQQELFNQRLSNTPTSTFDDMLVGLCYEKGIGAKRNPKSAADIYSLAANKGSVEAMAAAGRTYMEAGSIQDALKYLDMAAANGDPYSGFLASKIRIKNASGNISSAVDIITRCAESGLAEAQAELGSMYLTGRGVSSDRQNALIWLRKAAEGGNVEGMWQYGNALIAERDYDEALFWLSMAAQAGRQYDFNALVHSLPSREGFRKYVDGMKAYLIEGNYASAIADFQAVGKSKSSEGKVMEMIVLADKNNSKQNPAKAAKELSKLADGSTSAAIALAEMYADGRGVDRDSKRAVELYRNAANAGDGRAQNALANILYEGRLTNPDRNAAADLYKKALAQHRLSTESADRLRSMYQTGSFGIDSDDDMASRLKGYNAIDPVIETLKKIN